MRNLAVYALSLATLFATSAESKPSTGDVTGTITVKGGGKDKGVVVYLEDVPGPIAKPKNATVKQREKQFDPPLTIVVKGTTVDFPNEDKIFHNVFSVSKAARFDLGLYKSGTQKSVEMKREGVIDVYCNIHPDMVAKIKVLGNPYYTVTGPDGKFVIQGVPAGEYPIVAWLPSGGEATGKVTVAPGGKATVDLEVKAEASSTAHTRKDGTPYGRYK